MVRVDGGTFTMGGTGGYNESPRQFSTRVGSFALDAYEVTVARFRRWVAAGRPVPTSSVMYRGGAVPFVGTVNSDAELNCDVGGTRANYARTDRENHPINCVNWSTAQAFCVWDGNGVGRLPTQAEWEFATRGPSGRGFPWGGVAGDTPSNAQACWSGAGMSRSSTCAVGSVPAGDAPGGIHDLAGNVDEWNADRYDVYRSGAPGCWTGGGTNNPVCTNNSSEPSSGWVIRGGSWDSTNVADLRAGSRWDERSIYRSYGLGFRCARDTQ
ncbi:MAG: formylglycine-generating enzyme family protein [Polyangiales bacterium]